MPTEAVRRARQRVYSAEYRRNKHDRRSPERRDVAEAIASLVMERAKPRIVGIIVKRLARAGFDRTESQRECERLFAAASSRR